MKLSLLLLIPGLLAAPALVAGCSPSGAAGGSAREVSEVRITRQYGLGYLPLVLMEADHLVEQEAAARGLPHLKVTWSTLGSGAASTDALLSESVDFTAAGVAPAITLWSKTGGEVKALAALGAAPQILTTSNPRVHSVKDFTEGDRIALPAAKVSIQAVLLEMAAAKAYGEGEHARLDRLTVSMKHPDAMAALLSGGSHVTAHFAVDPFAARELKDPRIHAVLKSYDVVGGPHTQVVLCAAASFHDRNPRVTAAVLAAIRQACARIRSDKKRAAELYVRLAKTGEKPEEVLSRLQDPDFEFDVAPRRITAISDFMARVGVIKSRPASWKELFFADLHGEKGS